MDIIPDSDLLGFEPRLETVQFVKSYETTYFAENLMKPAENIRDVFRKVAQEVNRKMQITWQDRDWPIHKPTGSKIVTDRSYQAGDYDYLESPDYDVDFIVMLVKSLQEIGPELGHLLLRSREAYYHTFVISLDTYTSSEIDIHRNALDKVPTRSVKEDGHNILVPYVHEFCRFNSLSPVKQGLLSIHQFEKLDIEQIRGQLTYMTITKLGKTGIMNNTNHIDENDIDTSIHEEGEEWKPEGWEPDNN